jgi:hypothetical protein
MSVVAPMVKPLIVPPVMAQPQQEQSGEPVMTDVIEEETVEMPVTPIVETPSVPPVMEQPQQEPPVPPSM